ncbi:hypothetical protein IPM09_03105 [Candidatus Saccharibacteria bacterium]|nr:MAG: hypothetical protein IPM09_03105 [Candidatus Saccharibacteria bacterium]
MKKVVIRIVVTLALAYLAYATIKEPAMVGGWIKTIAGVVETVLRSIAILFDNLLGLRR